LDTYESERRPIAADVLGLSTKLLTEMKDGKMKRGRDTQQLDIGYPESSLNLKLSSRGEKIKSGNRAPDAPCQGATKHPTRLFNLFKGTHWTLFGYEVDRKLAPPSTHGLHIHFVGGPKGDILDSDNHIKNNYQLEKGDWVLIRPDGYIAAIEPTAKLPEVKEYLKSVGIFFS